MTHPCRTLAALAAAAFLALGGCLQVEQGSTIFPDGSGKLLMKVGFKKSMLKMIEEFAKQGGGDAKNPLDELNDPAKLAENAEGFVAFTAPKKTEDGDFITISFTGYFEDINKVKMHQTQETPGGEAKKTVQFAAKYEKTDSGYSLTMNNDPNEDFRKLAGGEDNPAAGNEELAKAMLEMMKPMLEGMKVTMSVTVPGAIQEVTGFMEKKDRTATMSINADMILAVVKDPKGAEAKKLEALGKKGAAKVTWASHTVSDAEVAAFKKEMAEAKDAWGKILEDAKNKKK